MIIRVGLPTYDNKSTAQTKETVDRLKNCTDIKFEVYSIDNTYVATSRNLACCPVVSVTSAPLIKNKMPYEYYLAMDSDMSFGVDNIKRLIATNKDIVGAAYGLRTCNSDKIVAGHFDRIEGDTPRSKWLNFYDSGLVEVDWIGAGCLLIKKEVLESMEYPYFTHNIIKYENMQELVGEDISFCMNARKTGFKIWCDLDNRAAHIAH